MLLIGSVRWAPVDLSNSRAKYIRLSFASLRIRSSSV